ncbi:hypothetical protein QMT40_001826 [Parvibaculaceae bacterium PLY_AMNH_Bact1]|nr:hypothetical protein QMT40_001826 [Parvibaculaceae bacterium PLY_AMNH_Bact1]
MSIPYARASSGKNARDEVVRILQHFDCESVGFMDLFHENAILLAFTWRGQNVQLKASAQGWANTYLKANPWNTSKKSSKAEWEDKAFKQGMIAVNSILRDWVKGQVTAVETGILTFEHVFMPYMLASDGRPVLEHMTEHLSITDQSHGGEE